MYNQLLFVKLTFSSDFISKFFFLNFHTKLNDFFHNPPPLMCYMTQNATKTTFKRGRVHVCIDFQIYSELWSQLKHLFQEKLTRDNAKKNNFSPIFCLYLFWIDQRPTHHTLHIVDTAELISISFICYPTQCEEQFTIIDVQIYP